MVYTLLTMHEKPGGKDQDFFFLKKKQKNNSSTLENILSTFIYFPWGAWVNITGMGLGPSCCTLRDLACPFADSEFDFVFLILLPWLPIVLICPYHLG